MDLASYLTIRTLLSFKSLIGLEDKLIKGDPRSCKSWTLYYSFTKDWRACKLAQVLTKSGLQSKYLYTHTYIHTTHPGDLLLGLLAWSHYMWPPAGWNKSSVQVRDWCWMIIQPLAGLRQGFSTRAGGVRISPVRWFMEPEARDQSPPVDWLTWFELLKEASSNPGARQRSAVSTAITPHRWDGDQRPELFSHMFEVWLTNGDSCEVVAGFYFILLIKELTPCRSYAADIQRHYSHHLQHVFTWALCLLMQHCWTTKTTCETWMHWCMCVEMYYIWITQTHKRHSQFQEPAPVMPGWSAQRQSLWSPLHHTAL